MQCAWNCTLALMANESWWLRYSFKPKTKKNNALGGNEVGQNHIVQTRLGGQTMTIVNDEKEWETKVLFKEDGNWWLSQEGLLSETWGRVEPPGPRANTGSPKNTETRMGHIVARQKSRPQIFERVLELKFCRGDFFEI